MEKVIVEIRRFNGEEEHIMGKMVGKDIDLEISDPPKDDDISHITIYKEGEKDYNEYN